MTHETIIPLNYKQSAIEDLRTLERSCLREAPYSAYVLRNIIKLLETSVKFILPNCADFIAPDDIRQTHLDLARLPYPVVTFEIPWEKNVPLEEYSDVPTLRSTKRIALCWELNKEIEPIPGILAQVTSQFPGGGVFICPIFWVDEDNRWQINYGGTFYPYDNTLNMTVDLNHQRPATKLAFESLKKAGLVKQSLVNQFQAEPFIILQDFAARIETKLGSRDKLFADIIINSRDELQSFINACSILNCANVIVDTLSPEKKRKAEFIRGKRVKPKGRVIKPRFTYKILQISDEKKARSYSKGVSPGSQTKRMHLRRGHIRRLEERLIWVRPAVVNSGSKYGEVTRDCRHKM